MVQEVRSGTAGFVCDLSTAQGVAKALAHIRQSTLGADDKRSLRDLLFLFTNSGSNDTALRTLIESRLRDIPVVVSAVSETSSAPVTSPVVETIPAPVPVQRSGFGGGRPRPQFGVLTPQLSAAPQPVVTVTPVDVPVVPVPAPLEHLQPDTVSDIAITPAMPHRTGVEPEVKAVVDEKLASVAPVAQDTVAYEPLYREDASLDTYRERISEIKRSINTRVGNPVNLVDIDNALGREYMTTLLEAMKTVSGGGGDVVGTMKRLEAVVAAVMKRLDAEGSTSGASATPQSASAEVERPAAVPLSTRANPVITPSIPKKADPVPSVSIDGVAPEIPTPLPVAPVAAADPLPEVAPAAEELTSYSVPIRNEEKISVDPMTIASSRFKNVAPVSAQVPLKTPQDLPTAADMKARMGITDPLEDPDVDMGLDQLLGEWSLFKKSGMFGTGPRGRQHPLYQKLAPLTIPLILSGRFEGATPEIKQSVTDYMSGWRYEQGIVHNPDETFEHYLRRVIRHIIDSQTRRRSA